MEKYLVLENWDGGSEYRFGNKKDAIAFAKKLVRGTRWTKSEMARAKKECENFITVCVVDENDNIIDDIQSFVVDETTVDRMY